MPPLQWKKRLLSFRKALAKLKEAVEMETYSEMENEALVKRFEFTVELSWKTLQDLFKDKGFLDVIGPKTVAKHAFLHGYIEDDEGWVKMLEARNLAAHIYDEEKIDSISIEIKNRYFPLLKALEERLTKEEAL